MIRLGLILLLLATAGCSPRPEVRGHGADAYPQRLSEWGLLERSNGTLVLGRDVVVYEVNAPLFSDYALKLRTLYLPPGSQMRYQGEESFDFPVGSIITKTFFYPLEDGVAQASGGWHGNVAAMDLEAVRLLETRLLVKQEHGWDALPYVWDGDDATLRIVGAVTPMQIALDDQVVDFPYLVPARSECASCHASSHAADSAGGSLRPIGIKARQLNRDYPGEPGNQLTNWAAAGRLAQLPELHGVPHMPPYDAVEALHSVGAISRSRSGDRSHEVGSRSGDRSHDPALEARARSYLDSNCGHCHSASGGANTSGLLLDVATASLRQLGVCKRPIAAGRGTGGHSYSIMPGDPDASIIVFRMEATDPAIRMPEIGRVLRHAEGIALVRAWVETLPGTCT